MLLMRIFILLSLSNIVFAEHKSQSNQVYNRSSELTVENINNAVSVIRDPTKMSGNFRQAINSFKPSIDDAGSTSQPVVPKIKLIGKVYFPKTLNSLSKKATGLSSVVLEIANETLHLKEDSRTSIVKEEHVFSIHVVEINKNYVTLKLQPSNETLVLH